MNHEIWLTSHKTHLADSVTYHSGTTARQVAAKEIRQKLQEEVIDLANSERYSSIVFASKKDSSLRFCVDLLKRMAATVKQSYKLKKMEECIDFLAEITILLTFGANSRYKQIEIDERHR